MNQSPYFQSNDPHDTPPAKKTGFGIWPFLLLVGALLLALILLPRGGASRAGYGEAHPSVGNAPPRWRLEPLTGDPPPLDLAALQGKVTLVNFWGTWCPPCQVEFPHIVALWNEWKERDDFQLAAVSCEPGIEKDIDELRTTTERFLTGARTTMPTYYDPEGTSRIATMDTTGEDLVFPATLLFGRDGKLRGYWRGYMPGMEKEVEAAVRAAFAE